MKIVLIAICITSYWLALLVLLLYRASSPVLVASVLGVAGTTALGALAVCDAVVEVGTANRIAIMEAVGLLSRR